MSKVLLIEDEITLAAAIQRVLEVEGYDVIAATDPEEGLAAARKGDFQVVVTDLKMPGISGMEVIKELHERRPQLPVILMTGHHTTEAAIEAMKLGAYDYILKPPDPPEFLALIEKAVANSRLMSEQVEVGQAGFAKDAIVGSSRLMQNVYKEIGDMSPRTQAKLLRVLQDRSIQRLGGKETIPVDVRVIAATHRNLELAIQEKQFREDLYYRLNHFVITLPPLRDRPEDIAELVRYFFQRYTAELGFPTTGTPTTEAVEFLRQQPWPGNVRELRNIVRKSLLLARGYSISREIIDRALAQTGPPRPSGEETLANYITELLARAERGDLENVQSALSEIVEKELFRQAIKLARGDQTKAAGWIGVSRPTMKDKLLKYGLHPSRDGS